MIIRNLKEQLDKSISDKLLGAGPERSEEHVESVINEVSKSLVSEYISEKKKYTLSINISTQLLINQWEDEINLDQLSPEKLDFFHRSVPQELSLELNGVFLKDGFVGTYEYNSQSVNKFMNYILGLLEDNMSEEEIISCQTQIVRILGVKYVILDLKEIEQIHPINFILRDENQDILASNIEEFKRVVGY